MFNIFKKRKKEKKDINPPLLKGVFLDWNEKEGYIAVKFNKNQDLNDDYLNKKVKIYLNPNVKVGRVVVKYSEESNAIKPSKQEKAKLKDCKKESSVLIQLSSEKCDKNSIDSKATVVDNIVFFDNVL